MTEKDPHAATITADTGGCTLFLGLEAVKSGQRKLAVRVLTKDRVLEVFTPKGLSLLAWAKNAHTP